MPYYYVGVFLNARINVPYFGNSSYVNCFVEAPNEIAAKKTAEKYYTEKYHVGIIRTRIALALRQKRGEFEPYEIVLIFDE